MFATAVVLSCMVMSSCGVTICYQWCCLQPLPPSLRVLDAGVAPAEAICQLTALQQLCLMEITNTSSNPRRLGMLGQLTSLQLRYANCTDWSIFEGCTGLRTLLLGGTSCLHHAAWVWVLRNSLRLAVPS
jgi:hypothetical protein